MGPGWLSCPKRPQRPEEDDLGDPELVARARAGEPAAFEELARRHFRTAYAIAIAILGNSMDAEDVCQDALFKALRALDGCKDPSRFGAWLGQIVRNTARNARDARRVRDGPDLATLDAVATDDPARDAQRADLGSRLMAAMTHLTETQREVLLLHDLDGWEHRDIGVLIGATEGVSRQHLFKARRALRARLGRQSLTEYIDD